MLRLAALGALVATMALVSTGNVAGAGPQSPAARAGLISAIRGKVCDFLDGAETLELPFSLAKFVASGEVEASTVLLFGVNQGMCGGGSTEKLFSLAHDWLLSGIEHNYPVLGNLKLQLPTLAPRLSRYTALQVSTVALPSVTFSSDFVGTNSLVPMTVSWLATGFVTGVQVTAEPLSSLGAPFVFHADRKGLVGTHSFPIGLSSGKWRVCIRADSAPGNGLKCGQPFWIRINTTSAEYMNSHLGHNATVTHPFYGSQIGVAVSSASGSAWFHVDKLRYTHATLKIYNPFGGSARFFAYWAWNLGEGPHKLYAWAPDDGAYGAPAVLGHILAIVTISST